MRPVRTQKPINLHGKQRELHISTTPMVSKRPSGTVSDPVYDPKRFPYIAETLSRNYGMTQKQLADVFGVTLGTFEQWVYTYPELKAACKAGRDVFDGERVEQALLKRALGYQFVETTRTQITVKGKHKYEDYEIRIPAEKTVTTIQEIPADVKAIMFWLTNRNAERWRMVTTVNANIKAETQNTTRKLEVKADLSKMNKEQLLALKTMIQIQGPVESEAESEEVIPMLELLDRAQKTLDAEYSDAS